jgi:hypothetical protein
MQGQTEQEDCRRCLFFRLRRPLDTSRPRPPQSKLHHHQLWRLVSKTVLSPSHPYHAHHLLHEACFSGWDSNLKGPPPLWSPDRGGEGASFRDTNLARLMSTLSDLQKGREAAFCPSKTPLISSEWNRRSTGCPLRDYGLLHRVSVSEP